jgi:hypothetical protein
MPMTPKGTVTARTSRPLGRRQPSTHPAERVGEGRHGLDGGRDRLEAARVEREAVDERLAGVPAARRPPRRRRWPRGWRPDVGAQRRATPRSAAARSQVGSRRAAARARVSASSRSKGATRAPAVVVMRGR